MDNVHDRGRQTRAHCRRPTRKTSSAAGLAVSIERNEVYRNVRHVLGCEGAKGPIRGERRTYPDPRVTVDHQVGEADWIVSLVGARA